jgi:X-X-X-Leu-X-X-Gly heptad repeat protein
MMKDSAKRRVSMRLLALCLGTSGALIAPSVALGADLGTGGTVRATIGDNGSVTSVKQVGANGATSAFSGQLPVKMTITHNGQTYSYHVENTFTKTQTVHFTDTAGNDRHTTVSLQLPLVAQLGVDVPKSMSNLSATGATVTTGANGVRHVLWNMVLFAPLGSSAQDVSFTAAGSGTPIAELRATPVDPSTTAGLSSKSQDKTAEFQQEDFWAGYASGGNDGLKKLGAGVGQILDGLNKLLAGAAQLHSGLAGGLSGTNAAAAGSTQLADGAKQLTAGLALIHGGLSTDPTTGLTGGLALIHAGLSNNPLTGLSGGLRLIHNGLQGKAGDPTSGLVPGLTAISAGLDHPVNAGGPTDPGGLVEGLQQIAFGLSHPAKTLNPADPGGLV